MAKKADENEMFGAAAPPPRRAAPARQSLLDLNVPEEAQKVVHRLEPGDVVKGEKGLVDLNFKVPPKLRREFRMFCTYHEISHRKGLESAFRALKAMSKIKTPEELFGPEDWDDDKDVEAA